MWFRLLLFVFIVMIGIIPNIALSSGNSSAGISLTSSASRSAGVYGEVFLLDTFSLRADSLYITQMYESGFSLSAMPCWYPLINSSSITPFVGAGPALLYINDKNDGDTGYSDLLADGVHPGFQLLTGLACFPKDEKFTMSAAVGFESYFSPYSIFFKSVISAGYRF